MRPVLGHFHVDLAGHRRPEPTPVGSYITANEGEGGSRWLTTAKSKPVRQGRCPGALQQHVGAHGPETGACFQGPLQKWPQRAKQTIPVDKARG